MRTQVRSLTSLSWLRIQCCHELWCSSQTQLRSVVTVAVVCRPADAAPIQSLAWEPTYAVGAALKRPKKKMRYYTVTFTNVESNLIPLEQIESLNKCEALASTSGIRMRKKTMFFQALF